MSSVGQRRSRVSRRRAVVPGLAAVALTAGLALAGCTSDAQPPTGSPSGSASASTDPTVGNPTPTGTPPAARTVTDANLVAATQLLTAGKEKWRATAPDLGREPDHPSVCVPDEGLAELAAKAAVRRNFRLARLAGGEKNPGEEPFGQDPTVYTVALQFDTSQAAAAAYGTLRSWLDDCTATIEDRGDAAIRAGESWYAVRTGVKGAKAGFSEAVWYPRESKSESAYFESTGIALVGDRVALAVTLAHGMDYNVAYDPKGDKDLGLPPHPQYKALSAAAQRLTV